MAGPRGEEANLISHVDHSNTLLVSETPLRILVFKR